MNITNEDNMQLMSRYDDKHFDLAIVDPPYMENINNYMGMQKRLENCARTKIYNNINNFGKPNQDYFDELFRVSRNQIIWGANHFKNFGAGRIIWNKDNTGQFNDCEIAYQSKSNSIRIFKWRWNGMIQQDMKNKEIRIHPTQKPVKLYEWLLMNYAKEGDKILDTHLGSGSIAIACHNLGFDLTACELDKEYYNAATKRIKEHKSQKRIF